jgi:hypothetical protein
MTKYWKNVDGKLETIKNKNEESLENNKGTNRRDFLKLF